MKKMFASLAVGLLGLTASFAATMHLQEAANGDNYFTFDGNTQVNISLSSSIVAVGWYDYSNPTELKPGSIHNGILDFFRPGAVIGIWVETKEGLILTSSQTSVAGAQVAQVIYMPENPAFGPRFYIGGPVLGDEFYSYAMADSRWGHPPGTPLPGALTALVLCGGAAALYRMKRKQK